MANRKTAIKLTKRLLDATRSPETGQIFLRDAEIPGFGVRLTKRGKTFFSCTNYPNCKFAVWARPVREACPRCSAPFVTERMARGKVTRQCIREDCGYRQEVAPTVA